MANGVSHRLTAPLIVTALMGKADFQRYDQLRRAHFPPERNLVPAHITLFHHLPPSRFDELSRVIAELARGGPPRAEVSDVLCLGNGTAFRVQSPELLAMRERVAAWFAADLIAQDQHVPQLHITIQNKVLAKEARALAAQLRVDFQPRPLAIRGIGIWSYLDGQWRLEREFVFALRRA